MVKIPKEPLYTDEDVQRDAEWGSFIKEISGDSERGALLALAARLEGAAEDAVHRLKKDDPESANSEISFAKAVNYLEKFQIISKKTKELIDIVRELRNRAAHGARPFYLLDEGPPERKGERKSNYMLVNELARRLREHVAKMREDPEWAEEHKETGMAGDFKVAVRLLIEALEYASAKTAPIVYPKNVPCDLKSTDPAVFFDKYGMLDSYDTTPFPSASLIDQNIKAK